MTWIDKQLDLTQRKIPFVCITLVDVKGSTPQDVGARALITEEGLYWGTVGGGKVELKAIAHAQVLLQEKKQHDFVHWNLRADVGMTCGGVVCFFFEVFSPICDWNIAIFGAGHVAQELVRVLLRLNCQISCIDSRSQWLEKLPTHPKLKKVLLAEPSFAVRDLLPNTFVVSLTMGHAFDLPILTEALSHYQFPYVGVIGSYTKSLIIKKDLKKNNVSEHKIDSLFCPIGEQIGSNDPAEIALSIALQMIKIRDS